MERPGGTGTHEPLNVQEAQEAVKTHEALKCSVIGDTPSGSICLPATQNTQAKAVTAQEIMPSSGSGQESSSSNCQI